MFDAAIFDWIAAGFMAAVLSAVPALGPLGGAALAAASVGFAQVAGALRRNPEFGLGDALARATLITFGAGAGAIGAVAIGVLLRVPIAVGGG